MIPGDFEDSIVALAESARVQDNLSRAREFGMPHQSRIFVAGHRGLVGSAIVRHLHAAGFHNLIVRSRAELDLRNAGTVEQFFRAEAPEYVFLAAARVGGILANSRYPVDFLRDNLLISLNVVDAAWRNGAKKLLFLGSSCIYPKYAPQPIREEALLSGHLEPTNSAYAIAKIGGIELCKAYRKQHGFRAISLMPANLYGPGDNFDVSTSHVVPALIRRFHDAKMHRDATVTVWGSGEPRREFLHVDDLAEACLWCMQCYDSEAPINVGVGEDVTIAKLAGMIRDVVGYRGEILWDRSKPDGTPRKLLESSRIRELGWKPKIKLRAGLESTYDWFSANARDRNLHQNLFSPSGLWEPSQDADPARDAWAAATENPPR